MEIGWWHLGAWILYLYWRPFRIFRVGPEKSRCPNSLIIRWSYCYALIFLYSYSLKFHYSFTTKTEPVLSFLYFIGLKVYPVGVAYKFSAIENNIQIILYIIAYCKNFLLTKIMLVCNEKIRQYRIKFFFKAKKIPEC